MMMSFAFVSPELTKVPEEEVKNEERQRDKERWN
jgi:hypothetical protein